MSVSLLEFYWGKQIDFGDPQSFCKSYSEEHNLVQKPVARLNERVAVGSSVLVHCLPSDHELYSSEMLCLRQNLDPRSAVTLRY